jgi:hypothetical protein
MVPLLLFYAQGRTPAHLIWTASFRFGKNRSRALRELSPALPRADHISFLNGVLRFRVKSPVRFLERFSYSASSNSLPLFPIQLFPHAAAPYFVYHGFGRLLSLILLTGRGPPPSDFRGWLGILTNLLYYSFIRFL